MNLLSIEFACIPITATATRLNAKRIAERLLLLLACVLPLSSTGGVLFKEARGSGSVATPLATDAGTLRTRLVALDASAKWLRSEVQPCTDEAALNLFEDVSLSGLIEKVSFPGPGRTILQGTLKDEEHGYFTLATESNVVAGTVISPKYGKFSIQYAGKGLHRISQLNPNTESYCPVQSSGLTPAEATTPESSRLPAAAASTSTTLSVVDVLVLYTSEARNRMGDDLGISTLIDLAVAEANTAYVNSKVNLFLRLAGKRKISYHDSLSASLDLARLVNPADGYMDEALPWKKECKADLVCLFAGDFDGGVTGIAVQNARATNAFSVVQAYWVSRDNSIFAHELAHNFGCQHDRPNAASPGIYDYSYGHTFKIDGWQYGTIMSCVGQHILYFSNPLVKVGGMPTGTDLANNSQTLNQRKSTISAFSGAATTTQVPTVLIKAPTNNQTVAADSTVMVKAAVSSNVARVDFYHNDKLLGSSKGPEFSFALTNIAYGDHSVFARAFSSLGVSAKSPKVMFKARCLNDRFSKRKEFSGNYAVLTLANYNATLESSEPQIPGSQNSIWYTWTAPESGRVGFQAITGFHSYCAIYTGSQLTNLSLVASNTNETLSSFACEKGVTYQVAIGGYGVSGQGILRWKLDPVFNDSFEDALRLDGWSCQMKGNNAAATHEAGEPKHHDKALNRSLWWKWTAPTDGKLVISTQNPGFLPFVYVGSGITGLRGLVASPGSSTSLGVVSNTTYFIAVECMQDVKDPFADFDVSLQFSAGPQRPVNDDIAQSITLTGDRVLFSGSTYGATYEPTETKGLYYTLFRGGAGCSVWWHWTAPFSGEIILTSPQGGCVGVYSEILEAGLTGDDASGTIVWPVTVGKTYYLKLDRPSQPGEVPLRLDLIRSVQNLSNDNFPSRTILEGLPTAIFATTVGATQELGEPNHYNYPANNSVWFTWTARFNGRVRITVEPRHQWCPLLGVYAGNWLTQLQSIPGAEYSQTVAVIPVTNGMKLQIAVDGANLWYGEGKSGSFMLSIAGAPNDEFESRQVLTGTNTSVQGTCLLATTEPYEPQHSETWSSVVRSVWYTWIAPTNGTLEVSATGLGAPVIAVYTGNAINQLSEVQAFPASSLSVDVLKGVTYQIAIVETAGGSGTEFNLNLSLVPLISRPSNDNFENRKHITSLDQITGTTTNATYEVGDPMRFKTVWWEWRPNYAGMVDLSYANSLRAFEGTELTNLTALRWPFDVVPGKAYIFEYASTFGESIQVPLQVTLVQTNDNFSNRISLSGGNVSISGNNTGASREEGEPVHIGGNYRSLWYSWTAPESGILSLRDTSGASASLYTGSTIRELKQVPPTQDLFGAFQVSAGTEYQIAVCSEQWSWGGFSLVLRLNQSPNNDLFANRQNLVGNLFGLSGSNSGAGLESGESVVVPGYSSMWWSWTASTNGTLKVRGTASFAASISLFEGSSLTTLKQVQGTWDFWTHTTCFDISSGHTYQICITGAQGSTEGRFDFLFWAPGSQMNDDFDNRQTFPAETNSVIGYNPDATKEPSEPQISASAAGKTLWYTWTCPQTGRYLIASEGSDYPGETLLAAYTGTSLENLRLVSKPADPGSASFRAEAGATYVISTDTSDAQKAGLIQVTIRLLPLNDMFEDRLVLSGTNVAVKGESVGATPEEGEPIIGAGRTLWWTWTAPQNGRVVITHNVALAVLVGDSISNMSPVDVVSGRTLTARKGHTYHLMLDVPFEGNYDFSLKQLPAPVNDEWENALEADGLIIHTNSSSLGATLQPDEPPHSSTNFNRSIWWKWTAPETRQTTITVDANTLEGWSYAVPAFFDVYTSTSDGLELVYTGTNLCSFPAIETNTYYIALDVPGGVEAAFVLDIRPTPQHDNFADATVFDGYAIRYKGNCSGSTMETGENAPSVWHKWTARDSGEVVVSSESAYMYINVYTGSSLTNLTRIAGSSFDFTFTFKPVKGTTYYINVVGRGNDYLLTLAFNAGISNDDFANRIFLSGTDFAVRGNNSGATRQVGEPRVEGLLTSHSLWWTYSSQAAGTLKIYYWGTPFGPAFPPLIGIFTGSSLSTLKAVPYVHNRVSASLVFNTLPGTNYHILFDGLSGAVGDVFMQVDFMPAPVNDNFSNSVHIGNQTFTVSTSNQGATVEPGEPKHGGLVGSHSLWWSWTAENTGDVGLSISTGNTFRPRLAVYTGSNLTTLSPIVSNYKSNSLVDTIVFTAQQGTTYRIAVASTEVDFGKLTLTLKPVARPENDDFENATELKGAVVGSQCTNTWATSQAGEGKHAGSLATRSVWWKWTAGVNGLTTVNTAGTVFDTLLGVYTGSAISNLVQIAANDDAAKLGSISRVTFNAVAGQTYFFAVDGFNSESGVACINLQGPTPTPPEIQNMQGPIGERCTFRIKGVPSQIFILQSSTNLVDWENVSTNQCEAIESELVAPAQKGDSVRFYRLRQWP